MGSNLINREIFMVQTPTANDLKREAIYTAKQAAHVIEKTKKRYFAYY
jgi:hypothetical protein